MTKQEVYEQGFKNKCAEHGIDAAALVKEAGRGSMLLSGLRALSKSAPSTKLYGGTAGELFGQFSKLKANPMGNLAQLLSPAGRTAQGPGLGQMAKSVRNALKANGNAKVLAGRMGPSDEVGKLMTKFPASGSPRDYSSLLNSGGLLG